MGVRDVRSETGDNEAFRIRPYQPDDLDDLYRICLQTADNGQDATSLFRDPKLPGYVYVAPYVTLEPSLAFVAEDRSGLGGYIVGALDTRAFEQRLERDWWPALRARYAEPSQDQADDLSRPEQYAIHDVHHPWSIADDLARCFPSHLHINKGCGVLPARRFRRIPSRQPAYLHYGSHKRDTVGWRLWPEQ